MAKNKRKIIRDMLFEIYGKGVQYEECNLDFYYEKMMQALNIPCVSGSLLTDAQSYEIAQKFYEYCYMQQNDSLAIGAKAIPLIFNECLNVLASNDR